MWKSVIIYIIAIPIIGTLIVSAAGAALAVGGTLLIPASLAGLILALARWYRSD